MKRTYLAQIIGKFLPFAEPMIGHMVTFLHNDEGGWKEVSFSLTLAILTTKAFIFLSKYSLINP